MQLKQATLAMLDDIVTLENLVWKDDATTPEGFERKTK